MAGPCGGGLLLRAVAFPVSAAAVAFLSGARRPEVCDSNATDLLNAVPSDVLGMMVGLRLHASSAVPIPQQPHCSAAVYIGSSYLCGVGLIPTEAPDCSFSLNFGRALMAVPKLVERLWSREGANETETRAFGVEFEFHAAGAEVDRDRAVRKCFEEKFRG